MGVIARTRVIRLVAMVFQRSTVAGLSNGFVLFALACYATWQAITTLLIQSL